MTPALTARIAAPARPIIEAGGAPFVELDMDTGEVINAYDGEAPEQEGALFAMTLGEMRAGTPGEIVVLGFRRDREGARVLRGVDVLRAE